MIFLSPKYNSVALTPPTEGNRLKGPNFPNIHGKIIQILVSRCDQYGVDFCSTYILILYSVLIHNYISLFKSPQLSNASDGKLLNAVTIHDLS